MRKVWVLLFCFSLLLGSSVASAHGGVHEEAPSLTVLVNGVEVSSEANHQMGDGSVYVSVEAFATLFGKGFSLMADNKFAQFNGKTIENIHMINGVATAWIRDLANAVGAQQVSWDGEHKEVYVLALPEGTVQLDPVVVPAMGEHWANPQSDMPTGPIYGVYQGKLVFLEYMIAQEDFVEGKNHVNVDGMKGYPSPSVVQTDVEYQAKGHPGFEVPHFDIHMYFITEEEQQAIK